MLKIKGKFAKAIKAEYNAVRCNLRGDTKMKFCLMIENYGPFKKYKSYESVKAERDWTLLKNSGHSYYVPSCFIHPEPLEYLISQVQADDEDCELDEDFIFKY